VQRLQKTVSDAADVHQAFQCALGTGHVSHLRLHPEQPPEPQAPPQKRPQCAVIARAHKTIHLVFLVVYDASQSDDNKVIFAYSHEISNSTHSR